MVVIGINTAAIIQGGRTFMARNAPNAARKEVFGLGKCNVGYDKLFKAFLITEALDRDNNYTQEQIQCLESELLNEIQSQENLQPLIQITTRIGLTGISGATNISGGRERQGG